MSAVLLLCLNSFLARADHHRTDNFYYQTSGPCGFRTRETDNVLWYSKASAHDYFLEVQPTQVNIKPGQLAIFTVTVHDLEGNSEPARNAMFNGLPTDNNGQVVYVATAPGEYRYKATRSDSVRSNAADIVVGHF